MIAVADFLINGVLGGIIVSVLFYSVTVTSAAV